MADSDHCFLTFRHSVPTFVYRVKQNYFHVRIVIITGEIVGLADGIIKETCL